MLCDDNDNEWQTDDGLALGLDSWFGVTVFVVVFFRDWLLVGDTKGLNFLATLERREVERLMRLLASADEAEVEGLLALLQSLSLGIIFKLWEYDRDKDDS